MPNLQIKNIPESLHQRLKRHAKDTKSSMTSVVLEAIERELTRAEWFQRHDRRPTTDLGIDAASLLAEERALQDQETG